jgi:hypothetical protein
MGEAGQIVCKTKYTWESCASRYIDLVQHITDETGHQPRQFPFDKTGFCMWGCEPDIEEFRRPPQAVVSGTA